MKTYDTSNLQVCLTVQKKRKYPPVSKSAKNLAEELLLLLKGDSHKAKVLLQELVANNPSKSIEWYYEAAVNKLYKNNRAKAKI